MHAKAPEAVGSEGPVADLMRKMWGFMTSQAIYAATDLGLFDALSAGARSSAELSRECDAQADSLDRLLSFLASQGLLRQHADATYSLSEMGGYLCSDHPQSQRGAALFYCQPYIWGPWGRLRDAVASGRPAFNEVYAQGFFDYLRQHGAEAATFQAAMEAGSRISATAAMHAYDFSKFSRVIDVGGGTGTFLRGILERHPTLHGVLCDQPSIIAQLPAEGLPERLSTCGVDFFKAIPRDGDAYIYKRILHDWDDEDCIRMLRICRDAMAPQGRLLVIEAVLGSSAKDDLARARDLNMLVLLPGRERSEEDFRRLFEAAGFGLARVVPIGWQSILEGMPL